MSLSPGVPAIIVACCLALASLAVSMVAGLAANNPTDVILSRALVSMLGGLVAGIIIGKIGERCVRDRIASTPMRAGRVGAMGGGIGGASVHDNDHGGTSPTTHAH